MSYLGVELELDALFGHDTLELFAEEEKRLLLYVGLNHKTRLYTVYRGVYLPNVGINAHASHMAQEFNSCHLENTVLIQVRCDRKPVVRAPPVAA